MKRVIALLAAVTFSVTCIAAAAQERVQNSAQRTYFDERGKVIGESISYCSGTTQHWGNAASISDNYVEATYGCQDPSITVTFGTGTSIETRRNACGELAICTQPQPWPSAGHKVELVAGLHSN